MYALIVASAVGHRENFTERLVGASYIGITWPTVVSDMETQALLLQYAIGSGKIDWLDTHSNLKDLSKAVRIKSIEICPIMYEGREFSLKTAIAKLANRSRNVVSELWNVFSQARDIKDIWIKELFTQLSQPIPLGSWESLPLQHTVSQDLPPMDKAFFKEIFDEMLSHPIFYEHCIARLGSGIPSTDQLTKDIRRSLGSGNAVVTTELVTEPHCLWLVPHNETDFIVPMAQPYRVALLKGDYSLFERHTLENMIKYLETLPDKDHYNSVRTVLAEALSKKY